MPRLTRQRGGELLAAWLHAHPGGGTREDICYALNMTWPQFNRSLAYVRDVLAMATSEPVAYDPRTYVYTFAGENDEAAAYAIHRQKIALKQLTRLRAGTVMPAEAKFGLAADAHYSRYVRYLDNTIAELADVIALAQNGQDA